MPRQWGREESATTFEGSLATLTAANSLPCPRRPA
jgi:hypothetical protein